MNGYGNGRVQDGASHFERVRGHQAFHSMAGPEFMGTGAVFSPVRALPIGPQLIVWAVLILIGVGGCSIAWVDQQSYVPSPNICRAHETARTDCVQPERPASTVQPVEVAR